MEFDINRVYTAVNADVLKPGSRVFGADDFGSLRRVVEGNAEPDILEVVNPDSYGFRFDIAGVDYMLCYLVAEPNEPRRMTNRELARWLAQGNGQKATINGNAVCCHNYDLDDDDKEVEDCMIRGWDEAEWREPIVEEVDE